MRLARLIVSNRLAAIEFGPTADGWSVCADIPLQEGDPGRHPPWCTL